MLHKLEHGVNITFIHTGRPKNSQDSLSQDILFLEMVGTKPAFSLRCACTAGCSHFHLPPRIHSLPSSPCAVSPRSWPLRSASPQSLALWLLVRGISRKAAGERRKGGGISSHFPPHTPPPQSCASSNSGLSSKAPSRILVIFFLPLASSAFPLLLVPRGLDILYWSLNSVHTSVNGPLVELSSVNSFWRKFYFLSRP